MKIFRNKFSLQYTKNSILVIGNFDGLHKGHLSILNEALKSAKVKKLKVGLLTFDPSPKEFFLKKKILKLLILMKKKKFYQISI